MREEYDEATAAAATTTKTGKKKIISTANCVMSGGWHLQSCTCTFQFNYVSSVGLVHLMIFQEHRFFLSHICLEKFRLGADTSWCSVGTDGKDATKSEKLTE